MMDETGTAPQAVAPASPGTATQLGSRPSAWFLLFPLPRLMQLRNQIPEQLLIFRQRQRHMRPNYDHQIISPRQLMLHRSEGFPKQPLNPISPRRDANAARHADPQPQLSQFIRRSNHFQWSPNLHHSHLKHP